jgi:hypothetical protein
MLSVENEWSETACNRALSLDGGPMWFTTFSFRMWHNMRPGGATMGKWRIADRKDERGLFSCSKLQRWQPPLLSIKVCVS